MRHPVPMRATPTGTKRGSPKAYDGAVTPLISTLTTLASNPYAAEFDGTAASAFTYNVMQMFYQSENDFIEMNARL